jgi:Tannase and feruloyl esterase
MNHCFGGPVLDTFDDLAAIEDWVEKGVAPDRLIAKGREFPGRSRPLCPYPETPHYKGSGSTEDAANFVCRTVKRLRDRASKPNPTSARPLSLWPPPPPSATDARFARILRASASR